jgi:hypothetical protein
MNRNYITAPNLYKTGFLNNQTLFRQKQGLDSQDFVDNKNNKLENIYPIKFTPLTYGDINIPNNCNCLKYVSYK